MLIINCFFSLKNFSNCNIFSLRKTTRFGRLSEQEKQIREKERGINRSALENSKELRIVGTVHDIGAERETIRKDRSICTI